MSALPVVAFDPFGGRTVTARPVRPDDLMAVGSMLARASATSRRLRFFSPVPAPRPSLVRPMVEVDHATHEAVVALAGDSVIGIAEYVATRRDPTEAEVAVVVEDAYQRHGVAAFLFRSLARQARRHGIDTFSATVLPDNRGAIALARSMNPGTELVREDGDLRLRIPLSPTAAPQPAEPARS